MAVLAAFRAPRIDRRTLIAAGLAALAALIVLTLTRPADRVSVLVASRALPAGAALDAGAVEVRQMSSGDGLVGGTALGELEGWTLLAPVAAGEPLLASQLVDPATAAAPSSMSISVEAAHAALGSITAGDRVDIYVTWSAAGGERGRTELLAAGVEVLESRPTDDVGGGDRTEILFAVDSDLAPLIAAGYRMGELDLVRTSR